MVAVETFDITDVSVLSSIPDTTKVRNHLLVKGKITSWEAITMYGITRLADVIYRLRYKQEPLMDIKTRRIDGKDRFGQKSHWAEYYI